MPFGFWVSPKQGEVQTWTHEYHFRAETLLHEYHHRLRALGTLG